MAGLSRNGCGATAGPSKNWQQESNSKPLLPARSGACFKQTNLPNELRLVAAWQPLFYFFFGAALAAAACPSFFCAAVFAFAFSCDLCFWFAFGDLSPMTRKARPASGKVNAALGGPAYLIRHAPQPAPASSRLFLSGRLSNKRERSAPSPPRSSSTSFWHRSAGMMGAPLTSQGNDGNDDREQKARSHKSGRVLTA